MRVSVCLAAYNGSQYIRTQLESIIEQLRMTDELIIVDDCSTDDTYEIISSFEDKRIKLHQNTTNIGVNGAFSEAIAQASGEVIFLSDQDDIWVKGRLAYMLEPFYSSNVEVVATNYSLIDAEGNTIDSTFCENLKAEDSRRNIKNTVRIFLGSMNYFGCSMAFRASLRRLILPFPPLLENHDIWIALIGNLRRTISHLPGDTLQHRLHGHNASVIDRPLRDKLLARLFLIIQLLAVSKRMWRSQKS